MRPPLGPTERYGLWLKPDDGAERDSGAIVSFTREQVLMPRHRADVREYLLLGTLQVASTDA